VATPTETGEVAEGIVDPLEDPSVQEHIQRLQASQDRRIAEARRAQEAASRRAREMEQQLYAATYQNMTPEQRTQADARFQQGLQDDGFMAGFQQAQEMGRVLREHKLEEEVDIYDDRLDRTSPDAFAASAARIAQERELAEREAEVARKEKALDATNIDAIVTEKVAEAIRTAREELGLEDVETGGPSAPPRSSQQDYEQAIADAKRRGDGGEVIRLQREAREAQQKRR
jgi:hypothetical protein